MHESITDKLGVCQWFHFEDSKTLTSTIEHMRELNMKLLRTGISWADWHRPGGIEWYRHQFRKLMDAKLDLLVSVWHTPPSIGESPKCSAPPVPLRRYADELKQMIDLYGDAFEHIELWNEPNNRLKWDFKNHDPGWKKYAEMIRMAAPAVRSRGKVPVLGGVACDPDWVGLMREYGALDDIDIVGLHSFPSMKWEWKKPWPGWQQRIDAVRKESSNRHVWVTETGLATVNEKEQPDRHNEQVRKLMEAADAPGERMYWYTMHDLPPDIPTIEQTEGGYREIAEYHMGLIDTDGNTKPAYWTMKALLGDNS